MSFNSTNYPLRVAVIGSGPAGFYTVGQLFKEYNNIVEVDMFDKLPTPFGLVRYGVAPDHQKIKSVTKLYERIADNPKFRFWGNVEIGK
ncbi:MAG TPA: NADP oxidoreductase, partial [Chloroflexi bacterium]|nr:NADP oxidoreductase [Chloroflexota bacterium]